MKKIAFYFPQYHEIPENDEWWGKGFTDWTNVKKAKPLFRGHYQPHVPLNNNYYDLTNTETQEWQAKLAKQYGIDGFCYYHYWFEGRLLLEKPMENMLNNPKIDIPFCICWANETWARTWDGQDTDILIKQNFNESQELWEKHFEYLLPFFKDERYIKHNGKPVLIIYKPELLNNVVEMIEFWKSLAVKNGFNGLHIGFQFPTAFNYPTITQNFDFGIEFEPAYTTSIISSENRKKHIKYQNIWLQRLFVLTHPNYWLGFLKEKLHIQPPQPSKIPYSKIWHFKISSKTKHSKIYSGIFPSWDNTSRKKERGTIFTNATPQKFGRFLKNYYKKIKKDDSNQYLFINAWNEWAEGAHLEPDEKYGYQWLECIRNLDS